ncbi:MAG: ABC transporter permease [Bacteroidota bacterium]
MSGSQQDVSSLPELYPRQPSSWWASWRLIIHNLRSHRFLILQLVRVNILTQFKRSFIGLSWLFIIPIFSVIIWILLNGAGVVEPGDTGIPYPAYVLLSTSIWGFFSEIYKSTSTLISNNGKMLIMTHFPHEVLIAERIIVHLIRFSIPFAINLLVLVYFGVSFSWIALLFPLTLLPLLLIGTTLGLISSLLRVVAVDISNLMDEAIRLLMFLTPIVYAPKIQLGWLSEIVRYNPMTYLIGFSRDVLTQGIFFEWENYAICSLGVLLLFFLSVRIFRAAEPRILERLINI